MFRRAMVGMLGVLGAAALSTVQGPLEREAGACSCLGPQVALFAPDRVDDAPLNAKVRIETPAGGMASAPGGRTVLRVHRGDEIASSSQTIAPGGWLSMIELTPARALAPATQYEVAIIEPDKIPSTTVVGTFRTGGVADTTPPRLDAMGPAVAYKNLKPMGAACQVGGPWVIIDGVRAEDPGRPGAQLVFGVWLADPARGIDAKKPPTTIIKAREGKLTIGQQSLCDPHAFPIPQAASMELGIAALDEAGNASPLRRVRVDLAGARH